MKFVMLGLLLLCAGFTSSDCHAIGQDKKLHIGASYVSGIVSTAFVHAVMPKASSAEKFWYATALAMIPGIVKELCDSRAGGSGFDHQDLIADFVGAAAAPATILTVTWEW